MRAHCHYHLRLLALAVTLAGNLALGETVAIPTARDGFVRQLAPTLNYGNAGSLCVAGEDSVNANEEPRGRFDSLIEFDPADAIATLNTTYGPGGWAITSLQLRVSEQGAPQNPIFPRGVGTARCSWLPNATFTEGTGTPNAPVTGDGDMLTWDHLQTLLAGATEQVLGDLAGLGANGSRFCELPVSSGFGQAVRAGQVATVHLSPLTPAVGFTFHSRNFFDAQLRPLLIVNVEPIVVGDINCDDQLNLSDVNALVLALVNPDAFAATYVGCDINRADLDLNGLIDGRDISKFLDALLAP